MQIQTDYASISPNSTSAQSKNKKTNNANSNSIKSSSKDEYITSNNRTHSNTNSGTVFLEASHGCRQVDVRSIVLELDETLIGYYEGRVSLEDVKNSVKTTFESILKLNTDNGNNPDIELLLQRTSYFIIEEAMIKGVHANFHEGESIAKMQGAKHLEWFYYNSSYYYMADDVANVIKETMKEIAESLNFKDTDIEGHIKEIRPNGINFNVYWMMYGGGAEFDRPNIQSKNILGMFDINSKPPADFKIFYSTKCYDENEIKKPYNEYFKQTLIIEHLNLKFNAKMSLAEYLTGQVEKKSSFLEYFSYSKDSFKSHKETLEFLKNFCFNKPNEYNGKTLFDSSMLDYQNLM